MADYKENDQLEFRVKLCHHSTSPFIQTGIWDGQHICVNDDPAWYFEDELRDSFPTEKKSGEAVIKHQLKVEHFGVLQQAFIKFRCYGFPHSMVGQITRHKDSNPLVTSMRYTSQKFLEVSANILAVDRVFYIRAPGIYRDRDGHQVDWTESDKIVELEYAKAACDRYTKYVTERNMPPEMAREFLPFCYRQPFVLAGTIEAFFHWVDQRSKKNSEREIQILAAMCMEEFALVAPELHDWYMSNRWEKARLSP